MDSIVDSTTNQQNRKRRRTREDWKRLVKAWESSTQTQQAFCQTRGLCYRQFSQWKSRFKSESLAEPENNATHFVAVQLSSPVSAQVTSGVQVYLPNGIRIEITSEHHLSLLLGSAKALMALSC